MAKISRFGSEVEGSVRKGKVPGWIKIARMLESENWQAGTEFLMHATNRLVCPEEPRESLRRELLEVRKRCEAEKDEGKRQMIVEHQLGFLVSFIQMDRKTLECFIERKEQKDELQILRSKLRAQEQEIERKEEEERKREEEERKKRKDRERESKNQIERFEKELEREKQERKQCENKIKTLKTLVDGVVELAERERFKATREIRASKVSEVVENSSESNFRMSKQEPPKSTKIPLVPLTPHPISVFLICSINPNSSVSPRPFTISSFHPLLILTSLLSLHEFLRLAIPNPFLEMSTGMRPPPEPPPLL